MAFTRIFELVYEKLDDRLESNGILFFIFLSETFGLDVLLVHCQLRLGILALEVLHLLVSDLFVLLAKVLAVPIDVQHLLIEFLSLLFLFFWLLVFLEAVLQLTYFKSYLFKLHH